MKKIVGFGDSFISGYELTDESTTWPSLIAKRFGYSYHTDAVPGCGNDHIARQIYSWFANNPVEDTLAVVNWTWTSRWDFYIVQHETWITLGPTCVPEKLTHMVSQTEAEDLIEFYHSRANSSTIWNKFRNLQTIYAAQQYMLHKGIKSIQTYMDYEMFDQTWHAPDYIKELQELVRPDLQLFDGKNFVDWSHHNGFPVTIEGNHPLEQAHRAAADYWENIYRSKL